VRPSARARVGQRRGLHWGRQPRAQACPLPWPWLWPWFGTKLGVKVEAKLDAAFALSEWWLLGLLPLRAVLVARSSVLLPFSWGDLALVGLAGSRVLWALRCWAWEVAASSTAPAVGIPPARGGSEARGRRTEMVRLGGPNGPRSMACGTHHPCHVSTPCPC